MMNDILPDAVEYDAEENEFTITMLEDVDRMHELYVEVPVVREFVQHEIEVKREYIYEVESNGITGYEVLGFLYRHRGEEYTIPGEELGLVE